MLPTLSPQEFVAKWRKATLKERSAAQEHFIDLCHLVGHDTPAEADPTGQSFTFEAGASKQRGGQGWADVWKRGYFAWEYKGKHKDLDQAYQQLLQYKELKKRTLTNLYNQRPTWLDLAPRCERRGHPGAVRDEQEKWREW